MVRVFIAAPFFSDEQIDRVHRLETALAKNPYVIDIYSARFHQNEQLPFGSHIWRKTTFEQDLKFLRRADVVVTIRDFTGDCMDSGTAFEVGYAYAMQKPIILIEEKDFPPNLMLVESLHAFFKHVEDMATYNFHQMPAIPYEGPMV
ncbi:nucleoside 2-deoxyribosyltransferase [Falsibacillus albus]|uniref:Nucleoside 2-deoxyribosyltransferase n=1 Tax=Falsibacillus albus TaxID=2478915 RepID=A0A3L7K403_9BACI|nr:nucleoside 2-deoxyribosyltransferase [Falsibacillus albus]